MNNKSLAGLHAALVVSTLLLPLAFSATAARGQAPASAAAAATRQIGTVKSVAAGTLTVGTDAGGSVAVTLPDGVRVVQLAPGSTDLKTAQPAAVTDIAEGDRVLVVGKSADAGGFTATRVVLMKSSAIAQSNASRQQDWQRRGSGGLVSAVDTSAKTIAITSGAKKVTVTTTPSTIYRRYAPGSVKFEEAKAGTLADIQAGDQVRVRGDKSTDGTSVAAEEVVSGAFRNLAGTIVSLDAAANTLTLRDLSTKKNVVVTVTSESDLRALPPEMAARFAARARGGAASGTTPGSAAGAASPGTEGRSGYAGAGRPAGVAAEASAGTSGEPGTRRPGAGGAGGGYGRGAGGGDLSQVITRLPTQKLTDLKNGEALMIVASGSTAGPATAITVLSGVEPLLTGPQGASSFSISPWNLGGGGGEGGGEAGGGQ